MSKPITQKKNKDWRPGKNMLFEKFFLAPAKRSNGAIYEFPNMHEV